MLVWSDEITFGKYKGNTLTEIYKKDFNYLTWLVTKIKVSPFVTKKIDERLNPNKKISSREYFYTKNKMR